MTDGEKEEVDPDHEDVYEDDDDDLLDMKGEQDIFSFFLFHHLH